MNEIISTKTTIPMLSILITTWVAIYSIRKTSESNRISMVHNEMVQCIIDSIRIMCAIRNLLNDIANKISYYSFPKNELIETGYDRYWREIQTISNEFKLIHSKQRFVLPKKLYDTMQILIKKTNEGRAEAKKYNPQSDNFESGNNDLTGIVKEIDSIYVNFVKEARKYVGVDNLVPICGTNEEILKVEETNKS